MDKPKVILTNKNNQFTEEEKTLQTDLEKAELRYLSCLKVIEHIQNTNKKTVINTQRCNDYIREIAEVFFNIKLQNILLKYMELENSIDLSSILGEEEEE